MSSHIDWIGRRTFLQRPGISLGAMALGSLLSRGAKASPEQGLELSKGSIQPLHHSPKAKRIIWLYMAGGMTHLETFDHKPKLAQMHGKPMPESITKGQQIAQLQGQKLNCFAPQHNFKRSSDFGDLASIGVQVRRPDVHRAIVAYRCDQPRSGPYVHEHRIDDQWTSGDGFMVTLWIGCPNR